MKTVVWHWIYAIVLLNLRWSVDLDDNYDDRIEWFTGDSAPNLYQNRTMNATLAYKQGICAIAPREHRKPHSAAARGLWGGASPHCPVRVKVIKQHLVCFVSDRPQIVHERVCFVNESRYYNVDSEIKWWHQNLAWTFFDRLEFWSSECWIFLIV